MNFIDEIKELFFDTKEFYLKILEENYPHKYKKTGIYMKNIFSLYGYSRELVVDSISFFDYLSKNNFDFRNMDYFIMTDLNSFAFNDYKALFKIYDDLFIKKNYLSFFNRFDEFKERIKGENFRLNDSNSDLPLLLLIYTQNKVDIREHYIDNNIERFVESILKIITVLYWINKNNEIQELNTITGQILLKDDFIDKCTMKGIDINSFSFNQANYIANQIYNKEFMNLTKKIIK